MDSSIAAPIIATLLGGFFLLYNSRRNARRNAGQQLIAEFAKIETAFNGISNVHEIDPILRQAFPQLETKVNIFKKHLFWPWEKKGFKKVWIAYYNAYGDERYLRGNNNKDP